MSMYHVLHVDLSIYKPVCMSMYACRCMQANRCLHVHSIHLSMHACMHVDVYMSIYACRCTFDIRHNEGFNYLFILQANAPGLATVHDDTAGDADFAANLNDLNVSLRFALKFMAMDMARRTPRRPVPTKAERNMLHRVRNLEIILAEYLCIAECASLKAKFLEFLKFNPTCECSLGC